jgi:hypothetical protein
VHGVSQAGQTIGIEELAFRATTAVTAAVARMTLGLSLRSSCIRDGKRS